MPLTYINNFNLALEEIKERYIDVTVQSGITCLNFDSEKRIVLRLIENSANDNIPLSRTSTSSVAHALFNAGAMGISLSPALDHAFLRTEVSNSGVITCKLHLTYRGLLHLCYEAKSIRNVSSWVIYEKDRVRLSNDIYSKPQIDIPDLFGDRGNMVGAICTISTPEGEYLTTKMTAQELNQIAELSGNPAWHGPFADEFRKKQVLKRALHYMASAKSGRLANASKHLSEDDLDLYDSVERKIAQTAPVYTPPPTRAEDAFRRTK